VDGTWTIGELAELAAAALAADPVPPVNGRVTQVPNDRLIRWYGTVGLVDPPLSRTGRIARYGRRHLLQLVAVKRRQADGAPLAQFQAELVGAPDAYLESVAKLPEHDVGARIRPEQPPPDRSEQPPPDNEFWHRRPATRQAADSHTPAVPAAAARATQAATAAAAGTAAARQAAEWTEAARWPASAAELVHGIRLAPGVLLLLDADGPGLVPADAAAIRSAAASLIAALARYGYATETDADERNRP